MTDTNINITRRTANIPCEVSEGEFPHLNEGSVECQIYTIAEGIFTPDQLATLPPLHCDVAIGAVINGKGPTWLYARLVSLLQEAGAPWIAVIAPSRGSIVVWGEGTGATLTGDFQSV
jgi:CRISPR-associated protein (Cas_csx3)